MTRPAPIIAGTLAAILLLFGAYLGAYYAMLKGSLYFHGVGYSIPMYRLRSEALEAGFAPAHEIDRLIRPDYWSDEWQRTNRTPSRFDGNQP